MSTERLFQIKKKLIPAADNTAAYDGRYLKLTGGQLTGNFGVVKANPFFYLIDDFTGSTAGFTNTYMQAAEGVGPGERYGIYKFNNILFSDDAAGGGSKVQGDGSSFKFWPDSDGIGNPTFTLDASAATFVPGIYSGITGAPGGLFIWDDPTGAYQSIDASDSTFSFSASVRSIGVSSTISARDSSTGNEIIIGCSGIDNTFNNCFVTFTGTYLKFDTSGGNPLTIEQTNQYQKASISSTFLGSGSSFYYIAANGSGTDKNGGGFRWDTGNATGNGYGKYEFYGVLAGQGSGTTTRTVSLLATFGNTAGLLLAAGKTYAAPLKFTSGSLLSSAQAGAFEFLTDDFYGTITTGTARKKIALLDFTPSGGEVYYAGTNGRLTGTSNFNYNGTYLYINSSAPQVLLESNSTANIGSLTSTNVSWYDAASFNTGTISWSTSTFAFSTGGSISGLTLSGSTLTATGGVSGAGLSGSIVGVSSSGTDKNAGGWTWKSGNSTGNGYGKLELYGVIAGQGTGSTTRTSSLMVTIGNTANLLLAAGTTLAAPFKLTSGTNLTTAQAGAFEYNGTNLFFTRTGTTRENCFVGNDGATAPATNTIGVIADYYGSSSTRVLTTPNSWASVVINGTTYKIPLFT